MGAWKAPVLPTTPRPRERPSIGSGATLGTFRLVPVWASGRWLSPAKIHRVGDELGVPRARVGRARCEPHAYVGVPAAEEALAVKCDPQPAGDHLLRRALVTEILGVGPPLRPRHVSAPLQPLRERALAGAGVLEAVVGDHQ